MVFLLINEYHSLAYFIFDGNCTKKKSLSDIFSCYKSENGEMYRYTFIDFARKKEGKSKLDIDFQFLIWIENWMEEWPTDYKLCWSAH